MLEAAQMKLSEGVDVVMCLVETHGRTDTEALLADLEIVPCRSSEIIAPYSGNSTSMQR